MFLGRLQSVLRDSGWTPERRVDITAWIDALTEEGYRFSQGAQAILSNFGGLEIIPAVSPTDAYAAGAILFDPVVAASGELDRIEYWEQQLGVTLSPLAEIAGQDILLLAQDGRVFAAWD